MREKEEKSIYSLQLHETTSGGEYRITRVPGGWIYQKQGWGEASRTMTFVPYNDEFVDH